MSRSKKVTCAVAATVLLGAVVGAGLWWGGGVFTRQGWEATSWVSAAGGLFLLPAVSVWVWALRLPAFEQSHWGWAARVRQVGADQVGVHRAREGVGVYAARDCDAQLRPRIREAAYAGGVVLVVGDSTAGKTRAAWEAVAALVPRRWLFVPALGTDMSALPELVAAKNARRSVVWLDDVDKHLNTSTGLDHTLIQRLTSAGALVVVTVRTRAYNTYRDTATEGLEVREGAVVEAGRQLIRGLDPVRLERLWSDHELARAVGSSDVGLVDAAQRQTVGSGHGVAEYLAAAPELAARWAQAEDSVGSDGGHPRGHRLVAAAVDLARIGLEHAPTELLAAAHAHYPLPAHLRPEPFAEALAWATRAQYGTCGLLIPATTDTNDARWRPFDYLLDATDTAIPDSLWDTALSHTTDPVGLSSIGLAAYQAEQTVTAETAWTRAAEGGHTNAMFNLGILFMERGEVGEAETWLRRAVEAGGTNAMFNLGILLEERGEVGEAETWYRRAVEAGETDAMNNLGALLMERGEVGEAETWLRRAVEAGETNAMFNLGILLMERGEVGEAETWYRRAAEGGHTDAMFNLGILLEERGEVGEAETWLRRAVEAGGTDAMFNLGILLEERGEVGEAETWYRRAAEAGNTNAMAGLVVLLQEEEKPSEAETWLRRAAENGDTGAMHSLGLLLMERGEIDEAELWYRRSFGIEDTNDMAGLRLLPVEPPFGEKDPEAWYRRVIEVGGDTDAMVGLGALLMDRGEVGEAETWYRRAAENGSTVSMINLGDLHRDRGEISEAETWYRRALKD
ncbi:tetratricopeptide repeat protein [Nocardiopsis alba]|uniref:tetratricopeptide repeat protein n=1 Tax=Nocardiopsis alba TaxID=53437 RepID=UPI0036715A44